MRDGESYQQGWKDGYMRALEDFRIKEVFQKALNPTLVLKAPTVEEYEKFKKQLEESRNGSESSMGNIYDYHAMEGE
jgi:hypothetical protein